MFLLTHIFNYCSPVNYRWIVKIVAKSTTQKLQKNHKIILKF